MISPLSERKCFSLHNNQPSAFVFLKFFCMFPSFVSFHFLLSVSQRCTRLLPASHRGIWICTLELGFWLDPGKPRSWDRLQTSWLSHSLHHSFGAFFISQDIAHILWIWYTAYEQYIYYMYHQVQIQFPKLINFFRWAVWRMRRLFRTLSSAMENIW